MVRPRGAYPIDILKYGATPLSMVLLDFGVRPVELTGIN